MTTIDIAESLLELTEASLPCPGLTTHAVKSIENASCNYSVKSLFRYCFGKGIKIELEDLATEDRYYPVNTMALHRTLLLLMKRYDVDRKRIYRQTGRYYTPPKDLYEKDEVSALSVQTLLAVCDVIHCEIRFIKK